jgi:[acyl-carrier-protein] S-malonyltransferase
MQEAVPEGTGAMAAILGLDADVIVRICLEAARADIVSAANYNSPEQTVIAGHTQAVARAMELAKNAGAKRVIPLAVSVPSHCLLMQHAAQRLQSRLDAISFRDSDIPVIQNVDAGLHRGADELKSCLVQQLYQPVRWVDCIKQLQSLGCSTIIESGPGKVLAGLIKRIDKVITTLTIGEPAAFESVVNDMKK